MKKQNPFLYTTSAKRYHTYDYAMRARFGGKIARICLDAGMTCPNIDGTCGTGGCVYCSGAGSGEFAGDKALPIPDQLSAGMAQMARKWPAAGYIAYFQAHTNTYAPPEKLAALYEAALQTPGIVGIAVATRPDCLPDGVCEVLAHFAKRTYFTVELGLQTIHDATGARIHRGHTTDDFLRGYEKLAKHDILTGVHLINGLPGESKEMMLQSARKVGGLHPHMIKFHMLYIVENTTLADWYQAGEVPMLTRAEYVDITCAQLEVIPPQTIIGRLTGDGADGATLAPDWAKKKLCVLNEIDKTLARNDSCQGAKFCAL